MDVEIGISVIAKIYLHVAGNDLATPFEVKYIVGYEDTENGTVIKYAEPSGWSSAAPEPYPYIVEENASSIEKAIQDSEYYRDEALKRINELLEN